MDAAKKNDERRTIIITAVVIGWPGEKCFCLLEVIARMFLQPILFRFLLCAGYSAISFMTAIEPNRNGAHASSADVRAKE